jgi:hypothetical protein
MTMKINAINCMILKIVTTIAQALQEKTNNRINKILRVIPQELNYSLPES